MSGEGLIPSSRVEMITRNREAREERAAERAKSIAADRQVHACNSDVVDSETREVVARCESHWDACLAILAYRRRFGAQLEAAQ